MEIKDYTMQDTLQGKNSYYNLESHLGIIEHLRYHNRGEPRIKFKVLKYMNTSYDNMFYRNLFFTLRTYLYNEPS